MNNKCWQLHCEVVRVPAILWPLHDLLFRFGLTSSKSEAIRLIKQGAVDIIRPGNGERERQQWAAKEALSMITNNTILQVGKRRLLKVKVTPENCNYFMEVWDLPEDIPEEMEKILERVPDC